MTKCGKMETKSKCILEFKSEHKEGDEFVLNLDEIERRDICAAVTQILAANQKCTFQKDFFVSLHSLFVAALE